MEPAKSRSDGHQIAAVNALRGLAALWVCWFHITGLVKPTPALIPILATGHHGYMGVQVFFVVSGFVIPYALHRSGYRLVMLGRFLAKRLLRLHPPYLAVVAVFAASRWMADATGFRSETVTWPQVFAHLAFLNGFLGLPWLLDSFWTLAVEFQYYVSLGILFPLIARRGWITAVGVATVSGASSLLLPSGDFLPHHLPFFAMGIAVFRRLSLKAPLRETLLILAISAVFGRFTYGWIAASIGVSTALLMLFTTYTNRVLDALGNISYSLYLTHPLFASVVITQGTLIFGDSAVAQALLLLAALTCSIACAWPLYRLVEVPSKRWSANVAYRVRRATPTYTERRSAAL